MAINFESSKDKEVYRKRMREEVRKSRQEVLDKAKRDYEKAKWREEQAEKRGENTWMLPSVEARIQSDELELKKSKSKAKKKEKKKSHKKEKKKKKHKKRLSSSDSESEPEQTWVESTTTSETPATTGVAPATGIGPVLQRDDWMAAPLDFMPTISRNEMRQQKKREQEEERQKQVVEPGQHARELNPYWKDGGTGLPEEKLHLDDEAKKTDSRAKVAGDGGYSWWKKAYDRCVEKAEEEGKPLQDVARERYGSLEYLEDKLRAAKDDSDRGSKSYGRDNREYEKRAYKLDRWDRDCGDSKHRESSYRSRESSDRYDRERGSRFSDHRRRDYNSLRDEDSDGPRKKFSFMRPGDSVDSGSPPRKKFSFIKPGNEGDGKREHSSDRSSSRHREKEPSWKKRSAIAEAPKSPPRTRTPSPPLPRVENRDKRQQHAVNMPVVTESSSVFSDSESDSSDSENDVGSQQTAKTLTEQEKNEIGAKIVKAEIMGNDTLAKELKAKLEESRKAETSEPAEKKIKKKGKVKDDEDGTVVLSRTDRSGFTRPLPERSHPIEPTGGRRKKQNVATHDDSGDRARYFDDDDKFDLKSLVERERTGTAEDSNMMFARLAGRSFEKTDDDHQIDDVFMQRASKKQSDSKQEQRDRSIAIQEHKKKASALEKCKSCFENVAKHLILSIGTKAYLCLPNHRSMTEGHCFIVPMQHVAQATVLDEDVWDEIQAFKRCLTRMFEEQDEDCVFMETCMSLHKFPHMMIECVPMPREIGDMAPIYFKKALMESESEWSQNKKVVDLSQKNIKQAVPKGFPYFAIDFGLQGGFAHVIEEEKSFPWYFGREICGGMMDLEPGLWRKPHKDSFEAQRQKVLQFEKMWKPHDWTQNIKSSV